MPKIKYYHPGTHGVEIKLEGEEKSIVIEKTRIAESFVDFGGSFVGALGLALFRADGPNSHKILSTFCDYAKQYIEQFILGNDKDFNREEKERQIILDAKAIMENAKDHICFIVRRDRTIESIIKDFIK